MPEKVNILFLHHVSCLAGAENYLVSVWKSLDKHFHSTFVCQEPGPLSDIALDLGIDTAFLKMRAWRKFKNIFLNMVSVYMMIDYCHKNKVDLICSNCYRVTPYAYYTAKRLNIPVVTIIQDFIPPRKLKRFCTLKSDRLITVSQNISRSVQPYYQGEIGHVYNGLDVDVFRGQSKGKGHLKKELGLAPDALIVGMIAHIIPLKQHTLFLDAMKIVREKHPHAVFVIVGDSPDKKKLSLEDVKHYAEKIGLNGKVIFTGNRNDVATILEDFDVLVHPSEREAFGRVIMEAMAFEVPVVATDCGGPSEIIENAQSGILVPRGDALRIASEVDSLLNSEDRRKEMGRKARRHIEQNFSLDRTVSQINGIFDAIMKNWIKRSL